MFWHKPTTTPDSVDDEEATEAELNAIGLSRDDTALEEEEQEEEEKEEEGTTPHRWADDAEKFSSAVLACIPRTDTAKLAGAVAVISYMLYIGARLEACAVLGS